MNMDAAKDWNGYAQQGGSNSVREVFDQGLTDNLDALEPDRKSGLVITRASEIKPKRVRWLWDDRIPLGKCTLLAGEGGLGKSMVLASIAATVSRGGDWPCGEGVSPGGSTIILSAEDDAADTIVPRLMAADADCSKIYIVPAVRREDEKGRRSFNLQLDLPELEKKIKELGNVLLVIIDPITSYLGKVDSHKNAELRSVLEPLGEMAARLGVAVIANTHFSKAAGGSANNRVIGSVAFVNYARAAFIVTPDPDDNTRRLFVPSKTNLGRPRDGLAYRIVADDFIPDANGGLISPPYVKWEDQPVRISADQAVASMAGGAENKTAKAEAMEFLSAVLAAGPVPVAEVKKQARADGHTEKAIRTAREALGVVSSREGFGPGSKCLWSLPRKRHQHIDAQLYKPEGMGTYGTQEDYQGTAGGFNSIDAHHKKGASMVDKGIDVPSAASPALTCATNDPASAITTPAELA